MDINSWGRDKIATISQTIFSNAFSWMTRTTRTPAFWGYPPPPHDYPYYEFILDPKSNEDKVKVTNLKSLQSTVLQSTVLTKDESPLTGSFWSCLIRCANMKWIRQILLKMQSGQDSVHRRTDGQTDKVKPVYPPFNFVEAGGIKMFEFRLRFHWSLFLRFELTILQHWFR